MSSRIGLAGAFLVCCGLLAGCGGGGKKLYPVEGTVTIDGEPLEGATVTFTTESGTLAAGMTSASGKFKLLTAGQEGVPTGTYKVSVSKLPVMAATTQDPNDATKSYTEMMKSTGMKMNSKGIMEKPKVKSDIPERYGKPGALPDQVVPASGPITIELKSK